MALHINLEDLLSARTVESDRIEFKEGWNPDATYRSICPLFDFDEERTWFQVTLPIHASFVQKLPFALNLNKVKWDLEGIDNLLNQMLDYLDINEVRGIAGGIAGGIAEDDELSDIMIVNIVRGIPRDIASGIAGGIAGGIADKFIEVLEIAKEAKSRKDVMAELGLLNNANNFETYIQPLVVVNWLAMTIPAKPTSPKQQYLTTLKGRLVLELLKHKTL